MLEISDLTNALAAATGLSGLSADEDGFCVFQADNIPVSIVFLEEAGVVYVSAEIGDSPTVNPDIFYATMLEANCRFEGTAGGTLARCPETGKLVVTRYARMTELTVDYFIAILSGLLNAAELWQKLLDANESEADPMPSAEDGPGEESGLSGFTFIRI